MTIYNISVEVARIHCVWLIQTTINQLKKIIFPCFSFVLSTFSLAMYHYCDLRFDFGIWISKIPTLLRFWALFILFYFSLTLADFRVYISFFWFIEFTFLLDDVSFRERKQIVEHVICNVLKSGPDRTVGPE